MEYETAQPCLKQMDNDLTQPDLSQPDLTQPYRTSGGKGMKTPEPTAFTHSADCMCHLCLPGSERKPPEPTAEARRQAHELLACKFGDTDSQCRSCSVYSTAREPMSHTRGCSFHEISTALAEKDTAFNLVEKLHEEALNELLDTRIERDTLKAALEQIANHKFISYESAEHGNYEGQYGIGVVDGHRACAMIAREALK